MKSLFTRLTVLLVLISTFESCHVGRFFYWNTADINDHKRFDNRSLEPASTSFNFYENTRNYTYKLPDTVFRKDKILSFEQTLDKSGTVAFLLIKNDTLYYENYLNNREKEDVIPSFSMAKSFVSASLGIALNEGLINSVNDPITNYLEFENEGFEKITIKHLLDMQSGIKYSENYYNPFGDVAKHYYGTHLKKYVRKLKIDSEPAKKFDYVSVNTQILSLIIEKVTGKTIDKYFNEKIWSKIGTTYDASWSIDSNKQGTAKAFCCVNATAIDYAKMGRLYLNNGNWNGKQIVPKSWVKESTSFNEVKNGFIYSYQWWHNAEYNLLSDSSDTSGINYTFDYEVDGEMKKIIAEPGNDYYAQGILGQYIYIYPKKNIVIVRLGKKNGGINWANLMKEIAENN